MKIAVALSGGADSLMALLLLKEQGHDVFAVHAHFLPPSDELIQLGKKIEKICRSLQVNLHILDLSHEFEQEVISPFVHTYIKGYTPNPCALCNATMKFGLLLDKALGLGARKMATGHYAEVKIIDDQPTLWWAKDSSKNQSYFLSLVPKHRFENVVFPLASWSKKDVYRVLEQKGLQPVISRESNEICFIEDDYRAFLLQRGVKLPGPGPIKTSKGEVLGTHKGLWRYTLGQRRGIGVAYKHPLYVINKDLARNTLIVGPEEELWSKGCIAQNVNFLVPPAKWPEEILVQTRYRQKAKKGWVEIKDNNLHIHFLEPQKKPTPGQVAAIFSPQGQVLGAGIIRSSKFNVQGSGFKI
jgi:tRNA-specific 2-thiouridylase